MTLIRKKIKSNYQHLKINVGAQNLGIALKEGERDKGSRNEWQRIPWLRMNDNTLGTIVISQV